MTVAATNRPVKVRDTFEYMLRNGSATALEIERMACEVSGLTDRIQRIDARLAELRAGGK